MIKVNELRIRNLVKINNDMLTETEGEIYKVSGFNARFDLAFPDSTGTISLDHTKSLRTYSQFDQFIEPIELTEEWLFKFGFQLCNRSTDNFQAYWFGENPLTMDWMIEIKTIGNGFFYRNGHFKVNYVHQLQNLYFALTGVDLQLSGT